MPVTVTDGSESVVGTVKLGAVGIGRGGAATVNEREALTGSTLPVGSTARASNRYSPASSPE